LGLFLLLQKPAKSRILATLFEPLKSQSKVAPLRRKSVAPIRRKLTGVSEVSELF
jgi:hypothetical protein